MRKVRATDSASAGKRLVVLAINEQDQAWNFSTESFGSRVAESEFEMTESTPDFPGLFIASLDIPESSGDLAYRVEELGDATRTVVAYGSLPVLEGHITNFGDILDVVIPGSGVDGLPDITLARAQLELLSFGKGWWRFNKANSTLTLHLINTNEIIRTLRLVDTAQQAALVPPDAP